MRMKIRYVITALVLLWLTVSIYYLFPFVFVAKEPPSVVRLACLLALPVASRTALFSLLHVAVLALKPSFISR